MSRPPPIPQGNDVSVIRHGDLVARAAIGVAILPGGASAGMRVEAVISGGPRAQARR
ncbi:hypothetical protein L1787_15010 [Acuticoccus sp. M5D2P5]|uniref:hypothetical protein n=1 Tax=Acuticoccus kalidii TaxID=2910977 RepID=UPI001F47A9D6|nr:hypothetical protein [Acuticoccus kalidii]MCF3934710.1 hypothetical protein [Acuticoccus kalidii]